MSRRKRTAGPTGRVGIVGAGAAGAGVAYALGEAPERVSVFEKSRGVCGRAATRRRGECTYDHGANYLTDDEERVNELVTRKLDTEGLIEVEGPIHVFEGDGEISEGHGGNEHKWSYESGITRLGKRLFEGSQARIEHGVEVTEIERIDAEHWRLSGADGTDLGQFGELVVTPPAPQSAELLEHTVWEDPLRGDLEAAIGDVPFRTTLTAVLHYPFEVEVPYYALVNVDESHEIGWLSREECKPGHVPDGESLLIVQLSPEWSEDHYEEDGEEMAERAAGLVAELLDDDRMADPDWTDRQGWRYAQPDAAVDPEPIERAREHGLRFSGDWLAGEGRICLALRDGLETGDRIARTLEER